MKHIVVIVFLLLNGYSASLIGQIVHKKGLFVFYELTVQKSEDSFVGSNFLVFYDEYSSVNSIVNFISSVNNNFFDELNSLIDYKKKIYCDYGLYLNCIYHGSDSLASILKKYQKKMPIIDNLIRERSIYEKKVRIKNETSVFVYQYIVYVKLFYAEATYFNRIAIDGTPYVKNWRKDSITNLYLFDSKIKNENIGVLLEWDNYLEHRIDKSK
jgi:hypothetical protein